MRPGVSVSAALDVSVNAAAFLDSLETTRLLELEHLCQRIRRKRYNLLKMPDDVLCEIMGRMGHGDVLSLSNAFSGMGRGISGHLDWYMRTRVVMYHFREHMHGMKDFFYCSPVVVSYWDWSVFSNRPGRVMCSIHNRPGYTASVYIDEARVFDHVMTKIEQGINEVTVMFYAMNPCPRAKTAQMSMVHLLSMPYVLNPA